MADLRISSGVPAPAPQAPRSEAARSAQRAFFQAALNDVAPTAPVRPSQAQAPAAPVRASAPTAQANAAPPSRYARPGSLLDIKV